MKKLWILTVALSLTVFCVHAQTQIKPGVGFNTTSLSAGDGISVSGETGWQVGASVAFGEKFYFEPGVFYQKSSFSFTSNDPGAAIDGSHSGIRVPLAVGLDVLGNADSVAGLRVFGGASGFFVMNNTDDDDIQSPQVGIFAGAGLDIAIFYLDASYQWSLSNIQADVTQIDLGNGRGFFLTAGLRF
ncbi:MAG: hypothetical protein P8O16_01185 [Algoriphagus sp.]|uniref:hypothetical protein n=1 Tax=Algoriphagus sp. TaxID=1872435 RepID=UPI002605A486|nr:hypothetical protein [Algoriphagus sp.]MDG1275861.1 hypothetical protein [Algoriphagus sp.]